MIPGNDPASGVSRISWIPHHHDPRHYHLFFLDCLDSVAGAYFFPPVQNLSPTLTAQSLGPFPHVGHALWHSILFRVFDMTLLRGQIVPPPARAPCLYVFSVFAPAMWTPKRTQQIRSRHGLQNILQTFFPPLGSLPNHNFAGDLHRRRQLYAPTIGFLGST